MSVYNVPGTLTLAVTVFEVVALRLLEDSKRSAEKVSAATNIVTSQLKFLPFIKVAILDQLYFER